MLTICVACTFLSIGSMAGQDVNADQFARLVAAAMREFRDVSFLYEGRDLPVSRSTTLEDVMSGRSHPKKSMGYQGKYTYRASDGSTLLDYRQTHNYTGVSQTAEQSFGILGHKMTQIDRDFEARYDNVTETTGGPGVLNRPASPERIVFFWLFKELADPKSRNYRCLGWETIDGHRCLKVELDQSVGWAADAPNRPVYRMWIDVERGCHPLRVELEDKEGVRLRTNGVELALVEAGGGKKLWFPVKGRAEGFYLNGKRYETRVVGAETYFVLDGSLKINQDVPDSEFVVKPKRVRGDNSVPPVFRMDREGITKHLEKKLANAETQSKQLNASATAEDSWLGGATLPIVLGAAGVGALGLMLWLRAKRG